MRSIQGKLWTQWCLCALWLAACFVGSYLAMGYEFTPGRLGSRQSLWPEATALTRMPGRITAVAFLHPRCVCTRATVAHLVRVLKGQRGADLLVSAFVPPTSFDQTAWQEVEYVKTLRAELPGTRVFFDRGGSEARRFGAFTSGTILVYDGVGKEIFRGGITDRRGGERDNPGLRQFGFVLTNGRPAISGGATPVFGCPLVEPDAGVAVE